ncbi:MAG TPA: hypothetical protein VND64_22110 [Pirellulales bacterium]|nr:hypothetical protein [Pirellulales bacterium]
MRRSIAVYSSTLVIGGAIWALTAWAQQPEAVNIEDGNVVIQIDQEKPAGASAAGEDANEIIGDNTEVAADSNSPTLAGLKARYNEAEDRLAEVADEVAAEIRAVGNLDALQFEKLAERVRAAVRTVFEARQALQHAELADLQRRVAMTQRALAVREQSKQAVIDERTSNLMDEIESGGWRKTQARQIEREFISHKDVPRAADLDLASQERLLALELASENEEAKARFAKAQSSYAFAKKMHRQGYRTSLELDSSASMLRHAELQLKQSQVRLDALKQQDAAPTSGVRPLADVANAPDIEEKLLQLDFEEAALNLSAAQADYDLHHNANAKQPNSTPKHEMTALTAKVSLAKIQVQRARTKLDLHKRQHPTPQAAGPTDTDARE